MQDPFYTKEKRRKSSSMLAADAWLDSAQGSAYGALDVLGVEAIVRIDKSGRDQGAMRLELEWPET